MHAARARARSSRNGANDLHRLPGEVLPRLLLLRQHLTPCRKILVPLLARPRLQQHPDPGVCRLHLRVQLSQVVAGSLVVA